MEKIKEKINRITPEAQNQYVSIVMAIGTAKTQYCYLSNEHVAKAIATGIGEDLPYLIKELQNLIEKSAKK